MKLCAAYCITLFTACTQASKLEKQLIAKLLDGYTKLERPVANSSEPVVVKLHITLQQIVDLDEKNQILTINAWLNYVRFDAPNV